MANAPQADPAVSVRLRTLIANRRKMIRDVKGDPCPKFKSFNRGRRRRRRSVDSSVVRAAQIFGMKTKIQFLSIIHKQARKWFLLFLRTAAIQTATVVKKRRNGFLSPGAAVEEEKGVGLLSGRQTS